MYMVFLTNDMNHYWKIIVVVFKSININYINVNMAK